MEYKGIELKEITTLQVFDPPKKMLVWWFNDDSDIPEEKLVSAIVKTTDGIRTITSDLRNYPHCAEIPEEPKPRRATNKELAKWLAQGNGETIEGDWVIMAHAYNPDAANDEVSDKIKVHKWDDTDWHEPTVDYLGIGLSLPGPSSDELLDYELNVVDMPKYLENHYAKIGNHIWMAENLFVTDGGDGIHWNKDNGEWYYTWEAAKRIADKIPGWHLPSVEEWDELVNVTGIDAANLRAKSWNGAHEYSCFSAVPAGYWNQKFINVNYTESFWTSESIGKNIAAAYIIDTGTSVIARFYPTYNGYSVRLVKDR